MIRTLVDDGALSLDNPSQTRDIFRNHFKVVRIHNGRLGVFINYLLHCSLYSLRMHIKTTKRILKHDKTVCS